MSTLYELPGGGVGHYDDLFRAHMMLVMKHLSLDDMYYFARLLECLPSAYYENEREILDSARITLGKAVNKPLATEKLEKVMEKIADMVRIKKHYGKDGLAEDTEKLLAYYIGKAAEKGYKDPSGFFSGMRT
jgi:hypothetical protein